ncbi:MAG: DNA alkylation repair protein [Bacteroidetes bacterium]|nr:DNA alkylation repair protein [Bacteroidota bacterium]
MSAYSLKALYSEAFFEEFSGVAAEVISAFDKRSFLQQIFDPAWPERELKDRMSHVAKVLSTFLPPDFSAQAKLIENLTDALRAAKIEGKALEYMFLPAILEMNGPDHPEEALRAMESITDFTSCEFAIRPFFIKYPDLLYRQVLAWSKHSNHHVRRLASEGCRPRLPWAMALPALKKNPDPIIPVLENLKADSELFVRRSVANNLNDISKDHPRRARSLAQKWKGQSEEVNWVVKHGCRTLLKKGDPDTLLLFGFARPDQIELLSFELAASGVKIGETLPFSFSLINKGKTNLLLRLEYAVYFLRSNGSHSRKVFFISEKEIPPGINAFSKKQSFKPITTRKYYKGQQALSIIVNGIELDKKTFLLS